MGQRGPGSRRLVCRRLEGDGALNGPVQACLALRLADRARGLWPVRRRPGPAGLLLRPLLLDAVAALLHSADLHGSRAVALLVALRLVALLVALRLVLLLAGGPAAAGGLLAGRHDGSALGRLQRGGALARLHVGAHGAAEAVEVDVDQHLLGPLAVCGEAQADGSERAVVIGHALALLELEQLAHGALVAARVLEVDGEGLQVLAVDLVVAAVLQVPCCRVADQAGGSEPDAVLVGQAGVGPELDLVHEAVDVVGVAVKSRGLRDLGRLAEDLGRGLRRWMGVGLRGRGETRVLGSQFLQPMLQLLHSRHGARRVAYLATERRVECGWWNRVYGGVLRHAAR